MPLVRQKGSAGSRSKLSLLCDVFLSGSITLVVLLLVVATPKQGYCTKFETSIKLLNNDDFLLENHKSSTNNADDVDSSTSSTSSPHHRYDLYQGDISRISYESIHRILRDENEPIYRRDVSDLRYFQKQTNRPQHEVFRRSIPVASAPDRHHFVNMSCSNITEFSAETQLRNFASHLDDIAELTLHGNFLRNFTAKGLTGLVNVDLSSNQLQEIPLEDNSTVVFLNLNRNNITDYTTSYLATSNQHLRQLHLSSNRIRSLAQLNLSLLMQLEVLDLSCNNIENLDTTFFPQRMKNLKHLNLAGNHLGSIYRETFYNLLSLNTLVLSRNNITDIDYETFLALPNLQYLDLSHNRLKGESIRALQGIPDLVGLSIAYNPELGNSMQEFVASWSLKELDASGTGLCQIPAALAQSVRTLKLVDNWLKIINCGDLDSYPLLQYLDLSHSHIDDIEEDAIGRLEILETLFLDHNNLQKVPISLPTSLEHLFLHDNQIMDIQSQAFQGLSNLRTLDLSGNKLLYLPTLPLTKLITLNLQASGLSSLNPALVHTSPRLRDLLLEDNPIKCSDLLGIAEWASPCRITSAGEDAQKPNGRMNIKAKFLQMHNYEDSFKANGKCTTEGSTPEQEKPPNCVDDVEPENGINLSSETPPENSTKFDDDYHHEDDDGNNEGTRTTSKAETFRIFDSNTAAPIVVTSIATTAVTSIAATPRTAKTSSTIATRTITSESLLQSEKITSQAPGTAPPAPIATYTAVSQAATTLSTLTSSDDGDEDIPDAEKSFQTTASSAAATSTANQDGLSTPVPSISVTTTPLPITSASNSTADFGAVTGKAAIYKPTLQAVVAEMPSKIVSSTSSLYNSSKWRIINDARNNRIYATNSSGFHLIRQPTNWSNGTAAPTATTTTTTTSTILSTITSDKNYVETSSLLSQKGLKTLSDYGIFGNKQDDDSKMGQNFNGISGQQQKHQQQQKNNMVLLPTNMLALDQDIKSSPLLPGMTITHKAEIYHPHREQSHNTEIHIRDRHLIGTPVLMNNGHILQQQQQQQNPPSSADETGTYLLAPIQNHIVQPSARLDNVSSRAVAGQSFDSKKMPEHLQLKEISTLVDSETGTRTTSLNANAKSSNRNISSLLLASQWIPLGQDSYLTKSANDKGEIFAIPKEPKLAQKQFASVKLFSSLLSASSKDKDQFRPTTTMKKTKLAVSTSKRQAAKNDLNVADKAKDISGNKQFANGQQIASDNPKKHYTLNTPMENEAASGFRMAHDPLLSDMNLLKEMKVQSNERYSAGMVMVVGTTVSAITTTKISPNHHKHSTVNTPLIVRETAKSSDVILTEHAHSQPHQMKSEQWLDIRTATSGHPGLVIVISIMLALVLIVGLVQVYRCHKPLQRYDDRHHHHHHLQHGKRQHLGNDADAPASFLTYNNGNHNQYPSQHSRPSSNMRFLQAYNSPLHNLHVHELQKSTELASTPSSVRSYSSLQMPSSSRTPAQSIYTNRNSVREAGGCISTYTASSPLDDDAFYIELTHDSGQATALQNNFFPMELLSVPSSTLTESSDGRTTSGTGLILEKDSDRSTGAEDDSLFSGSTKKSHHHREADKHLVKKTQSRKFDLW